MQDEEPEKLADKLERAVDQMQEQSQRLEKETEATRADWQRKRADPKVPGAPQPEDDRGPPPEVGPPGQ
jgi:hypothetical protein